MSCKFKSTDQYFRVGVGALVVDASGHVLALERSDRPGCWQCPQGGLDPGEELESAVLREIGEETGIQPGSLESIARHPRPLAYELPEESRRWKTGRGQVHYWFLLRFTGADNEIKPESGSEFRAWRWMRMADLLEYLPPFKTPVYEQLRDFFAGHLA